jgi:hypothetical protein
MNMKNLRSSAWKRSGLRPPVYVSCGGARACALVPVRDRVPSRASLGQITCTEGRLNAIAAVGFGV